MNRVRPVLLGAFLWCCPLSVLADEISYNYWSFGGILANRQSDYTADDPNLEYELEISLKWLTFSRSFDDYELGTHVWSNASRSRNISPDSAYTLNFTQITGGFGVDYTSDVLSTFFRIGRSLSTAAFESQTRSASVPLIPLETDDLFAPPSSIFDSTFSGFSDTKYKSDDGNLIQMGIRYRISAGYEIGASILQSNMDSLGTEFSSYVQRDLGVELKVPGIPFTNVSLKLSTTIADPAQTFGLSLVFWF